MPTLIMGSPHITSTHPPTGETDQVPTAPPSGQSAHVADIDDNRGTEHFPPDAARATSREGCDRQFETVRIRLGILARDKRRSRTDSAVDIGLNLVKPGEGVGAGIVNPTIGPRDAPSLKHDSSYLTRTSSAFDLNSVKAFGHDGLPFDEQLLGTRSHGRVRPLCPAIDKISLNGRKPEHHERRPNRRRDHRRDL